MRLLLILRIDRDRRAEFLSYLKLLSFCVRFVMCKIEFYVFFFCIQYLYNYTIQTNKMHLF